jgi:chorismate mutase/prephenate dehydratase
MSKKKPAAGSPSEIRPPSAAHVKRHVLQLNAQIIRLCNERARLLSDAKLAEPLAPWLQTDALNALLARQKGPLRTHDLQAVFRELDSATRSLVQSQRVAYLGPELSYSHLAAISRFGHASELVPVSTIGGVFDAVERGDVQFGLVPIENSTDGRIVDTLDRFVQSRAQICGELPMPIHHNLLAVGRLADICEVHSKPQALSQCRNWLSRHLPQARQVASSSTTAAAQAAAADKHVAAIASKQAGINYGLAVIAANIEDNPDNVTRFAVISMQPAGRTGADKTSLLFELPHRPGALADAMVVFKRNRLNLTWIESFPKKGSQNEYLFFVELEGHSADAAVRRAIRALTTKTVRIDILGSYARSQSTAVPKSV